MGQSLRRTARQGRKAESHSSAGAKTVLRTVLDALEGRRLRRIEVRRLPRHGRSAERSRCTNELRGANHGDLAGARLALKQASCGKVLPRSGEAAGMRKGDVAK